MRRQHDHQAIRGPLTSVSLLSTAYPGRDEAWDEAFDTEEPGEHIAAVGEAGTSDNLVLHYFGAMRRFTLLSREEERALWRRIERERGRSRRALYMSPIALPILASMWHQVQVGALPLQHVVDTDAVTPPAQQAGGVSLEHSLLQLQALAAHLQDDHWRHPAAAPAATQRRMLRQERRRVWQQWVAAWEALSLHAGVYETMHGALDRAYRTRPDNPGLRAAYHARMRAQRELEQAKAQMLQANLRLVVHVAKRYRNRGVPFLDLIQEGNLGLMRALDKFEPQRGLKFVTYAHWWVRQMMSRAVIEQRSTIRLPGYLVDRRSKLRVISAELRQAYGRIPHVQELSLALGWAPHEVVALQDVKLSLVRLHEPITGDGRRLEEAMADERTTQPDRLVADAELRQCVVTSLRHLPEREAQLLRLRYGLDTDHPHSLQEIGVLFGLSRERIRQLEKIALQKLRHSASGAILADFAGAVE